MSQYMLETEEDMLAYFDVDFGHAINATYIRGGVSTTIKIILNRDDKFFNFLYQKAKSFNLEMITFGKHRKSNILLRKIYEKNGNTKIFVNIDHHNLIYEFRIS